MDLDLEKVLFPNVAIRSLDPEPRGGALEYVRLSQFRHHHPQMSVVVASLHLALGRKLLETDERA